MISTYVCDEEIYGALQAGAMAYLVKSVQRDELMRAIRKAAQGQRHIPAEVAARLAERVTRTQLSSRETEVLRLLVAGRRNREIAHGARHHRGDGQAARQQHPRQAGGGRSHRSGHPGAPARHCPARDVTLSWLGAAGRPDQRTRICPSTYSLTPHQPVDETGFAAYSSRLRDSVFGLTELSRLHFRLGG